MNLLALLLQFIKFGSLAFGGGFTILPLLFDTFVTQTGILSEDAFGNLTSIAQMTPGPVTINIATFVGFLIGGPAYSVTASLGLVIPSFFITGTALYFMKKYQDSWFIQGFLKGAHLVAFVMVLYAIVLFTNMSVLSDTWHLSDILKTLSSGHFVGPENYHVNLLELAICIGSFALTYKKVPITWLLFGSAIIGFISSFI